MRAWRMFGVAAAIAAAAVPAQAAVTTFASEAAYDAAVGPQLFFIDFNGLTPGLAAGAFAGQVDFGSPEAADPSQVLFSSNAMSDAGSTTASNAVGPVDGTFSVAVRAFGLVFLSLESSDVPTIDLFAGGGGLIATVASAGNGFFGVLSDDPITSFVINNGILPTGGNDRFFVDDFRANSALPAPGGLPLMLLGLGAISFLLLRRRSA